MLFGGGQYLAVFGWSAAIKPTILNNQEELDQAVRELGDPHVFHSSMHILFTIII